MSGGIGRSPIVLVALVAGIVALWILGTPPSAGPDEPDHVERGAALVRGQLDAQPSSITGNPAYTLPPWVGWPDPGCFAFESYTPATCATSLPRPTGPDVEMDTRADEYPVWGHLLPGLGTLLPAELAPWAARALNAFVPVVLVGVALAIASRRGALDAAGALVALTPMAWFMFAVVSPSAWAIGGGVALWVALLDRPATTLSRWVAAAAWAALVLPRRDGLVWAVLILSIALFVTDVRLRVWWRELRLGPQLLIAASTLATMAWGATADGFSSKMLIIVPLVPLVVDAGRAAWEQPWLQSPVRRWAAGAAVVVFVAVVSWAVMARRPGGFDRDVLRIIVGRTGMHLDEAIGVLGWLDTPIPDTMAMLWILALGALFAAALERYNRGLTPVVTRGVGAAVAVLVGGVVVSWVLEMSQGESTGTYWQGRYYLPFLAGAPIVLAAAGRNYAGDVGAPGDGLGSPRGDAGTFGNGVGSPRGDAGTFGDAVGTSGGDVGAFGDGVGIPGGDVGAFGDGVGIPCGDAGVPGGGVGIPCGDAGVPGGGVGGSCGDAGTFGGGVRSSGGDVGVCDEGVGGSCGGPGRPDVLARVIAGTVLVALNVSFAAALRRWGVGIAGPMTPWSWDTYDTPLPPALLLAGSVALSAVLWREVTRPPSAAGLQPVESSPQG